MNITAADVNELRKRTGAGMMDCKKALTEAEGDMEKAIEILRKKGAAVAAKRAERSANEGIVLTKISDDKTKGYIVEVNCETDFVAKSEDFVKFVNNVLKAVETTETSDVNNLLEQNAALKTELTDVMGKVGEKTEISRIDVIKSENGIVVDYIHPGSKLGVLVRFDNISGAAADNFKEIAKDIAMQVAAMKPVCTYREEVPSDLIEKEIEIYKEIARKEGKPEQILEKIAQGKLGKYYSENCLYEQAFIKDNSKSVADLINEFNKNNGVETKLVLFRRFHLGDENK